MKLEISFNEDIYREQIKLTFDHSWQIPKARNKRGLIIGIIILCLGSLILYGNGNIGIAFIIMGLISVCNFLVKLNRYNNALKETQKLTDTIVEKWKLNPLSLWEFKDDFFRFKFYGGDYKINWENFKYFNVVDKTIFFGFEKSGNHYTLSESEVGNENFSKIIEIVKSKIEPATNSV